MRVETKCEGECQWVRKRVFWERTEREREREREREKETENGGVSQRLAATSPISHRRLKTAGVRCSTYLPLAALWMQTDARVSEWLPASRRILARGRAFYRAPLKWLTCILSPFNRTLSRGSVRRLLNCAPTRTARDDLPFFFPLFVRITSDYIGMHYLRDQYIFIQ